MTWTCEICGDRRPDVDVRRCNVILGRGASRRPPVLPSADAVERFLEGR